MRYVSFSRLVCAADSVATRNEVGGRDQTASSLKESAEKERIRNECQLSGPSEKIICDGDPVAQEFRPPSVQRDLNCFWWRPVSWSSVGALRQSNHRSDVETNGARISRFSSLPSASQPIRHSFDHSLALARGDLRTEKNT